MSFRLMVAWLVVRDSRIVEVVISFLLVFVVVVNRSVLVIHVLVIL